MKKIILLAITILFLLASNAFAAEIAIKWQLKGNETYNTECTDIGTPHECCEGLDTGTCFSYQVGDVIAVQEDDAWWGSSFDPRLTGQLDFIIVQITGLPVIDVQQYLASLNEIGSPNWKRRRFRLDKPNMPKSITDKVERDAGFIVVTIDQWNAFIKDKTPEI